MTNTGPTAKARSKLLELDEDVAAVVNKHEEIAKYAHKLWIQRGCPIGSPEEDWYRAEEHILGRATLELDS